jgi:hypothetical protein
MVNLLTKCTLDAFWVAFAELRSAPEIEHSNPIKRTAYRVGLNVSRTKDTTHVMPATRDGTEDFLKNAMLPPTMQRRLMPNAGMAD